MQCFSLSFCTVFGNITVFSLPFDSLFFQPAKSTTVGSKNRSHKERKKRRWKGRSYCWLDINASKAYKSQQQRRVMTVLTASCIIVVNSFTTELLTANDNHFKVDLLKCPNRSKHYKITVTAKWGQERPPESYIQLLLCFSVNKSASLFCNLQSPRHTGHIFASFPWLLSF